MSSPISVPTGDAHIDRLLADLSALVQLHGNKAQQVKDFIHQHREAVFVDKRSGLMHAFPEVANPMVLLMGGLKNDVEEPDEADWWKNG